MILPYEELASLALCQALVHKYSAQA
jgi:hypothetical protein